MVLMKHALAATAVTLICYASATGQIALFDGDDMDQWRTVDGPAPATIEDSVMVARHRGTAAHTYLITKEVFSDFILELDVQVLGNLNSGILLRGIHAPEKFDGRYHGYQMEIDQSERQWTGGIYEELLRGWLYSLEGKEEERKAYKPSEWNHYRIEAIGDIFKIWVNDVPVLHMKDSATGEGVIGFQIHQVTEQAKGDQVRVKNVQIRTEDLSNHQRDISLPLMVIEEAED